MGSAFWTYKEAANRLGRTKRSVTNYVRRGLLTTRVEDGVNVIPREDVERLAVELGEGMPALNRKTFFELYSEVRRLKEKWAIVSEILQLKTEKLRPDKGEAQGVYSAASEAMVRAGAWSFDEMNLWSLQFMKIDELTVEAMSRVTLDPQPWTPFFKLCTQMEVYVFGLLKTEVSLPLEKLHIRLEEGHRHLRSVAIIWMEMHRGVTPQEVLRALDPGKDSLLKRLTNGEQKSNGSRDKDLKAGA